MQQAIEVYLNEHFHLLMKYNHQVFRFDYIEMKENRKEERPTA